MEADSDNLTRLVCNRETTSSEIAPNEADAPPRIIVSQEDEYIPSRLQRLHRLQAVDVLRGFTLAMMVFVNHCGSWPTWLPHSSWNGIHFADFVMPSFLFTVGISLTLSVLPRAILGSSSQVLHKVATRTGKLFLLGLFIQGGVATGLFPNYNLATLRIMGVLQRIAVTFMIAALLIIATSHASCAVQAVGLRRAAAHVLIQVSVVASIWFALYSASTLLVKVPSCPDTVPAIIPSCNVAAFVDFELLGPNHMYPFPTCRQADPPCPFFDPEGLYTTLGGAMLSTLLGVMAGYCFQSFFRFGRLGVSFACLHCTYMMLRLCLLNVTLSLPCNDCTP
eukprot:jgi/Botrbrau1/12379/Bobra.0084s0004.2